MGTLIILLILAALVFAGVSIFLFFPSTDNTKSTFKRLLAAVGAGIVALWLAFGAWFVTPPPVQ